MPRVPVAENIGVLPGVGPTPQARMLDAPEVRDFGSRQILQQSEALGRAGSVATGIAADMTAQANKVRLDDAQNRLMALETDLRVKASALRGRNALERPDGKALPDEFGEEFDKAAREIEEGLGNDFQKQSFKAAASQIGTRFRGALAQHMVGEQRTYEVETAKSGIAVAADRAIKLAGDDKERVAALAVIDRHLDALAKAQGWSPEALTDARLDARSKVHSGLIATMIASGQSGEAKRYYEANSADMTVQARATILPKLQQANDAQTGQAKAAAVWSAAGPKNPNDAIRQSDIERALRDDPDLKANPNALAIALTTVREEARAFNQQQVEVNSQNINAVFALRDSRRPIAEIERSDAWMALPEQKRYEVRMAFEREDQKAWDLKERRQRMALTDENRRLVSDQRAALAAKRADDQLAIDNAAGFDVYSDPRVLQGMSRNEVMALRPVLGIDATKSLLKKHETMQKPEGLLKVQLDHDLFNTVATEMNLDPFSRKPNDRERVGQVRHRIESLIDMAQSQKKAPLTRQETEALMREEMARTVTVNPGWWTPNVNVPVIQLSTEQAGKVVIPPAERKAITERLRTMNQRYPDSPMWAPTEENLRREFLLSRSRAGEFVTR